MDQAGGAAADQATAAERVRRDGRVLELVIATRDNGGSLDGDAVREATVALKSLVKDDSAGCVLLTSDGPNFCTGGDVRAFAAAADRGGYVGALAREFHDLIRAIARAQVPVVAAVHGWAAGAGMSLVCVCDIAIGGPGTRLRPGYPSIGFSPDGGMSWTLLAKAGHAHLNEQLAAEAESIAACADSPAGRAGVDAFVARRR